MAAVVMVVVVVVVMGLEEEHMVHTLQECGFTLEPSMMG